MQTVLDNLIPLYEAEHGIDFDSLFNSVEVLPLCLQEEYLHRTTRREWLRAYELLVPLRYGTFQGCKTQGLVTRAGDVPVVSLEYNAEMGLLSTETSDASWIV
jgi:hypothetical protein